jgi:hypothetical protein
VTVSRSGHAYFCDRCKLGKDVKDATKDFILTHLARHRLEGHFVPTSVFTLIRRENERPQQKSLF